VLSPTRLFRRLRLVPSGSGRTGVLVTAAGEPWLVRSGSRAAASAAAWIPPWTALPFQAEFVPFIDVLLNRLARGEVVPSTCRSGRRQRFPTWCRR
jgi:hypothetical protein